MTQLIWGICLGKHVSCNKYKRRYATWSPKCHAGGHAALIITVLSSRLALKCNWLNACTTCCSELIPFSERKHQRINSILAYIFFTLHVLSKLSLNSLVQIETNAKRTRWDKEGDRHKQGSRSDPEGPVHVDLNSSESTGRSRHEMTASGNISQL